MASTRGQRRAIQVGATVLVLDLLWIRGSLGGAGATLWVDDLMQLAFPAAAAFACWERDRRERGRVGVAWQLLGLGCLFWAAGQVLWSFDELVRQATVAVAAREVPFPSLADAGYLAFPVLAGFGLLVMPSRLWRPGARLRLALDAALMAVGIFAVYWTLTLRALVAQSGQAGLDDLIAFAYPALDAVLLTLAILAGAYAARHERRTWLLMLAGLLLFLATDLLFWLASGTSASGGFLDVGWPAAFWLVALAALQRGPQAADVRLPTEQPGLPVHLLPLVPLILAGGAAVAALTAPDVPGVDGPLMFCLVSLVGLSFAREGAWRMEARASQAGMFARPSAAPTGPLGPVRSALPARSRHPANSLQPPPTEPRPSRPSSGDTNPSAPRDPLDVFRR